MTTALVPLTTVVDALTLRLEAVEAEAVEVLGLGR